MKKNNPLILGQATGDSMISLEIEGYQTKILVLCWIACCMLIFSTWLRQTQKVVIV